MNFTDSGQYSNKTVDNISTHTYIIMNRLKCLKFIGRKDVICGIITSDLYVE